MGEDALNLLGDFPFKRLAALLEGLEPPTDRAPILMQIGEPQAAVPESVMREIAASADLFGRYPAPAGAADHRRAIAAWLGRRYRLGADAVDPERQILVTNGSREALFQAALAAAARKRARLPDGVRPAVLLPNPLYHVYLGGAVMADCDLVPVPATEASGFTPDFAALPAEVLDRTALCYLCTPGNPTGTVARAEALQAMIRLARAHDFALAVDECYSEIWVDAPPTGGLQAAAALDGGGTGFSHVLTFNSLSKRSGAPGLRCGFVAGDAGLIADLARVRSYGGATVPGPLQAAAAALWREETHVEANRARYRSLIDAAAEELSGLPGFRRPEAAFFLWLDVRETAGDGEAAAKRLWVEEGVKVMPGRFMARPESPGEAATPGDGYVRIALVHEPATVRDACRRIAAALSRGRRD